MLPRLLIHIAQRLRVYHERYTLSLMVSIYARYNPFGKVLLMVDTVLLKRGTYQQRED